MAKRKQPARLDRYANLARQANTSTKTTKSTRRRKSSKRRNWLVWFKQLSWKKKIVMIASPILAVLILIPIITYMVLANDIKDPERLMNRNNTGIVLLDDTGAPFYSVGRAEHRNVVQLGDISMNMRNALIASEDKDFYNHGGFSLVSIARALVTRVGGGSTITQQLVKNTLLSDERSYLRKYQELFMAIAVEQNYSKDQILDMYLNSVFFGGSVFGIDEASDYYFGVKPADLDLAQSTMLVGLLPAPNAYSPIDGDPGLGKQRQAVVLSRMVTNGYINEQQKTAAIAENLVYASTGKSSETIAPHFAEMVINQLRDKYGYEAVMRSGFQVKTTLDITAQKVLLASVAAGMPHINAMGGTNASAIVIDPTTGGIRALVGSADYDNPSWGKVNMVTTPRQPASTFKGIYYSFALADGVVTPATILHDVKTDFGGGYVPLDADKRFRGDVTVRSAINQSLNIPSVELMSKFGVAKSIEAAKALGITTIKSDGDYGLSLALGSAEVPLEEMTHAYAAFANNGEQYDVQMVSEINDKFGRKVMSTTSTSKRVISEAGAYLISNILSDNNARAPIFGSSLTVPGFTVAVKTGTTNDNRDALTIGYTPNYVVGVWVGNNDNTVMKSGGSDMAGPIWKSTMKQLLADKPDQQFPMPSTIVQRQVCRSNGGLADRAGPNTYNEFFMIGALPSTTCLAVPTMIDVCNLTTGEVESIDETKYDSTKYSKDAESCKGVRIKVCDTNEGHTVMIDAGDFDNTRYSRDTDNCSPPEGSVQVCDTSNGQVVMIPRTMLIPDQGRYLVDTTNCQKATSSP